MRCHILRAACLAGVLSGLCALGAWAEPVLLTNSATVRTADQAETLVVGMVSLDPKKYIPGLEAMAGYLASHLRDLGVRRAQVIVARDNAEMVQLLRRGEVDVLSETAFSGLHFVAEAGAEFLAREWKRGVPDYRTVFITRRDTGIRTLEDLRGRKVAFEDRGSTSGFLLPLAILKTRGLETIEVAPTAAAQPGRVAYAFAIEEVNIAAWVARRLADAGAISDQDWDDIVSMPQPLKDNLVVFYTSESLLRSAVLAGAHVSAAMKARITDLLLGMESDSEARSVLEAYNAVTRYDLIVGPAARGLQMAQALYPLVHEEVR